MNLLNYFTTIDTTASNSTGPCAPSGTLDCRGADSAAELNRQRERASIVICTLNADVFGFVEIENTTPAPPSPTCSAPSTRAAAARIRMPSSNTGGTLGTDAIRVQLIYRTGIAVAGRLAARPTSIRSTTGRPPPRPSTSSMRRTRPSASASR